jgi:hypothetical protein
MLYSYLCTLINESERSGKWNAEVTKDKSEGSNNVRALEEESKLEHKFHIESMQIKHRQINS